MHLRLSIPVTILLLIYTFYQPSDLRAQSLPAPSKGETSHVSLPFHTESLPNVWRKNNTASLGSRTSAALNYIPALDGFLVNLGSYRQVLPNRYPDLFYRWGQEHWLNFLPDSHYYGTWADSFGNVKKTQLIRDNYFIFKKEDNHFIPQLVHNRQPRTYHQYAYNSEDGKVYFYIDNKTCSYDPINRRWEIYDIPLHPNSDKTAPRTFLKWGSMCYDAYNKELVLIGGGAVYQPDGSLGMWTFDTKSKRWNKFRGPVPPPRANSAILYNPEEQKILFFGGDHLDYLTNDTWVYDCKKRSWQKRSPSVAPPPLAGHALLYLPKSKQTILMGGYQYKTPENYLSPMYSERKYFQMWKYDWTADQWSLIKSYDHSELHPIINVRTPQMLPVAVDQQDRIVALAVDSSSYYNFEPVAYEMQVDARVTDTAGTRKWGFSSGMKWQRTGSPFDPSYFEKSNPSFEGLLYDTMPENIWIPIPAALRKYPRVNRDWGTAVLDPIGDRILQWSGGHSAHCGNDVPSFYLGEARWEIPYFPDIPLEFFYANDASPGGQTFNNRPFMPVHTYNSYDFDPKLKKMVAIIDGHTQVYDPDKGEWASNGVPTPKGMLTNSFYLQMESTDVGLVFWGYNDNVEKDYGLMVFRRQSDSTYQWEPLPYTGPELPNSYVDQAGMVYDSKRHRLLFFRYTDKNTPLTVMSMDTRTHNTKILEPTDGQIAAGQQLLRECVYIPPLDIVLFQARSNDSQIIYDCASNQWKWLPVQLAQNIKSVNTRSSGYMWDPKRKIVLDCEANGGVYALKLSGVSLAAGDASYSSSWDVYPNPTSGQLYILLPKTIPPTPLTLFNAQGTALAIPPIVEQLTDGHILLRLDLTLLPSGLYVIVCPSSEGFLIRKVMVVQGE